MDVYMSTNPKRLWGKPLDPPPYKQVVDLLRSEFAKYVQVFVLRDKKVPIARRIHVYPGSKLVDELQGNFPAIFLTIEKHIKGQSSLS